MISSISQRNYIRTMLVLCMFFGQGSTKQLWAKMEMKMELRSHLLSEKSTLDIFLSFENKGSEILDIIRPKMEDFNFEVVDLDRSGEMSLELISISDNQGKLSKLRPKCSIKIYLASIEIFKNRKPLQSVSNGRYKLIGKWEFMDKELKLEALFMVNEYPLVVSLHSSAEVFCLGKDKLKVFLENKGENKISFYNIFHPSTDFFDFKINARSLQKKEFAEISSNRLKLRSLVTLSRNEAWITLSPGESISIDIDNFDFYKEPGKYQLMLSYDRNVLIHKSNGEKYYSQQTKWYSNKIDIEIPSG